MFKELFYPLVKYLTFFNIFQYITLRAAYAAVTALLISFLFGPRVINMLKRLKLGQEVRHDGPQTHLQKAGTPTMGGILMIISVVISVLLWQDFHQPTVWIVIFSILGFGLIGFLDDYLKISKKNSDGLRAGVKFGGQVVVSAAVMIFIYLTKDEFTTKIFFPFLTVVKDGAIQGPAPDLGIFIIPFGIFLIVGFSNAVNLTDGLDGLATGLMIIALLAFTIISYLTGHTDFAAYLGIPYIEGAAELTVVCLALLGACVGFLWFNSHPCEIMMGDTGSLMLGAVLSVISITLKKELLLLIVGGVFVLETLSVMIQVGYYKMKKKRVFKMAPLHHHFELSGWAETKVVTRFWILGGMFAIIALSTLKIQ